MHNKRVQLALRQIGFVGLGPFDWIYQADGITAALPAEETRSFEQAIRFLREGAFQPTLQRSTRKLYYQLSELLASYSAAKGINGRKQAG